MTALKIGENYHHPQRYAVFEFLADIKIKEDQPSDYLKKEMILYLQKALETATICFPPQSIHITHLQSKLNKYSALAGQ